KKFTHTSEHWFMTDDKKFSGFLYHMSSKHISNLVAGRIPKLGGKMTCPFDEEQSFKRNAVIVCVWFVPDRLPDARYVPLSGTGSPEHIVVPQGVVYERRRGRGRGGGGQGGR